MPPPPSVSRSLQRAASVDRRAESGRTAALQRAMRALKKEAEAGGESDARRREREAEEREGARMEERRSQRRQQRHAESVRDVGVSQRPSRPSMQAGNSMADARAKRERSARADGDAQGLRAINNAGKGRRQKSGAANQQWRQ